MARNYRADMIRDEVAKAQKALEAENARHTQADIKASREYKGDRYAQEARAETERHAEAVRAIRAESAASVRGHSSMMRDALAKSITDPISEEAVRALSSARSRKVDRAEFDMLASRYGGNYQAVRVLEAIADENGYGGGDISSAIHGDRKARRLAGYAAADVDALESQAVSALGKEPGTIASGVAFNAVSQAADSLAETSPDA